VPTMVTYEAIYREGKRYGIGDHQVAKINLAREQSVQGLTYAYRAGCKIGSGSDLLGDMAAQRAVEFELKAQVMKPMEVLLSATKVNAELFRMQDRIGTVEAGKLSVLVAARRRLWPARARHREPAVGTVHEAATHRQRGDVDLGDVQEPQRDHGPRDVHDGVHGPDVMEVHPLHRGPVHAGLGLGQPPEDPGGALLHRRGQAAALDLHAVRTLLHPRAEGPQSGHQHADAVRFLDPQFRGVPDHGAAFRNCGEDAEYREFVDEARDQRSVNRHPVRAPSADRDVAYRFPGLISHPLDNRRCAHGTENVEHTRAGRIHTDIFNGQL